jgi:hypothetical protein
MTGIHSRAALPIRIAHPAHAELEFFTDDYFEFLKQHGYEGFYLQDSPFDVTRTGNSGNFKRHFHLISLYEIAYGYRREEYREYIGEICRRAARHRLDVHLCLWEPRLPDYARNMLPPEWQGRGGFLHHKLNRTAFCWAVPEAVAYWKRMVQAAFVELPEIRGVHVGLVDNEASFCDATCPNCRGESAEQGIIDVFSTIGEVARGRDRFRLAVYDWWLNDAAIEKVLPALPEGSLLIGRSARGLKQTIDGAPVPGEVEDITAILDTCSPRTRQQQARADQYGLAFVDMVSWSHPIEHWWLPAPPDPTFAINKLKALAEVGAVGWYDFDCGAIEPGSIAEAIRVWSADSKAAPESILREVLVAIYGDEADAAARSYELFGGAKSLFPVGMNDASIIGFSGRCCGLGLAIVGPFHLEDFRFYDTGHAFNWFAPFNLLTVSVLEKLLPLIRRIVPLLLEAVENLKGLSGSASAVTREIETFEIYHRHYVALKNYCELALSKRRWLDGELSDEEFLASVRSIAADELDNLAGVEKWLVRNPAGISNPCHQLLGTLTEVWPGLDFESDLLAPKRRSLEHLCKLDAIAAMPAYAIHGLSDRP